MHIKIPMVDRFWHKVDKSNEDGCWEWIGTKNKSGYGILWISDNPSTLRLAHRISWELHFSPIPEKINVCHTCDNPPCVNPKHLFLGTFKDNMDDKVAKERHARGEKTPTHILTENAVIDIRNRYNLRRRTRGVATRNDPNGARALAAEYGVSIWAIFDAVKGRRWAHVKE
jgi:hypothetical protein